MIVFFADEHFRQHPGKVLYEGLPDDLIRRHYERKHGANRTYGQQENGKEQP